MSEVTTQPGQTSNEVWKARRSAGLTEKALAERLGVSLWEVERLERGEVDPSPYAETLSEHTGRPRSSFLRVSPAESDSEDRIAEQPTDETVDPISPAERSGDLLVLVSIA